MNEAIARRCTKFVWLILAVATPQWAIGQATAAAVDTAPIRVPEFEAVSIKPNNSGRNGASWGVWKNEYSARNTPLARVILEAYFGDIVSSPNRLKNAPSWVLTDPYDITAKADDATADSWKGLRQAQQVAIAAPLLRTMLEERCELKVHTIPVEIPGYALIVRTQGTKIKEARSDDPVPTDSVSFEGEWRMVPIRPGADAKQTVTYWHITMAEFTAFLSGAGTPIVDQTGLSGKYNLELPRIDISSPDTDQGVAAPPMLDAAHAFN